MDPESNDWCSYKKRYEDTDMERRRSEDGGRVWKDDYKTGHQGAGRGPWTMALLGALERA